MKHCQLDVGETFFEEMERKSRESPGEVVMVIPRPDGKLLLSTKDFYLPGVYRLPSGQIKRGENPADALEREVFEETGLLVGAARELDAVHFMIQHEGRRIDYISYLILTTETVDEPSSRDPAERITGFEEVEPCGLQEIARILRHLPGSWHDWGRFRAIAHDCVHRKLCRKQTRNAHEPQSG
jgi:8-oxo-dGTP pyrophosphatase MutT (NUDIX family)